ncbi:MAG TPA: hypothetical protein VFT89_00655 [Rhizobiaceae bacterium]|nr:hypothetical protein [Rhizobiaceae bacterium]
MSALLNHRLPPYVVEGLRNFVQSRKKQRPVSISAMLRATRYLAPNLPYTDAVLADLLAKELIHQGCAIEFDSRVRGGYGQDSN